MPTKHKSTAVAKSTPPAFVDSQILRMKDVVTLTNLCDSTIYDLIAKGKFPPSFKIIPGGRAAGWASATISKWLTERVASGTEAT